MNYSEGGSSKRYPTPRTVVMRVGDSAVRFEVGSEALDVDVERLGVADIVGSPDPVDQSVVGEHPPGVLDKKKQKVELLPAQLDVVAREPAPSGGRCRPLRRRPRSRRASSSRRPDRDCRVSQTSAAGRRAYAPRARGAGRALSRSRRRRPRDRRPCRSRSPWP